VSPRAVEVEPRQGYGRAAMVEVIRRLKLTPEVEMIATSHRCSNTVAARLYRSLGFVSWDVVGDEERTAQLSYCDTLPSHEASPTLTGDNDCHAPLSKRQEVLLVEGEDGCDFALESTCSNHGIVSSSTEDAIMRSTAQESNIGFSIEGDKLGWMDEIRF
jgi:hypothetical protein